MATDNFEFDLVSDFTGYNSSRDKTNIKDTFLIRGSQNVYKKLSGTIASRPGRKRYGAEDSTLAGIAQSYVWKTALGATLPLRVVKATSAGSDAKLQVLWSGTGSPIWYDLLTGQTLTRYVFDCFFDAYSGKDSLLMVRGDSNILSWSGGITQVGVTTATTITKLDTTTTWAQDGFVSGTTIEIDGVTYTFSGGETTTTLTGVTPDPSAITSGSVAVQSIVTTTDTPSAGYINDFIAILGNAGANQLFVGSYSSKIIYVSADGTTSGGGFDHFTNSNDLVAGDATSFVINSTPTGMAPRNGKMYVSGGSGDWYEVTINVPLPISTLITGSYRAYVGTTILKLPGSATTAALAHEFIKTIGNDIVYLSKDNQLKMIGTFKDILGQDKFPSISQYIQDELEEEDFTDGHIQSIGDFIYLTAPVTGRHYLYQVREAVDATGVVSAERLWHPPWVEGISRFDEIDGVVYGHSNQNPELYQIWGTGQWHDDVPGGTVPYTSVMRMAYKQGNGNSRRQGLIQFDKIYFEGYMSDGTALFANALIDYQGASSLQNLVINSNAQPAKLFSGNPYLYLGASSLGENPLGDGLVSEPDDQSLLPKFRAIRDINPVDCFEYAIEVYSSDEDSRWEIIALGANPTKDDIQATFLRN